MGKFSFTPHHSAASLSSPRRGRPPATTEPEEVSRVFGPKLPFDEGQRVEHRFRGYGTVIDPNPIPSMSFVTVQFDEEDEHRKCFPESLWPAVDED